MTADPVRRAELSEVLDRAADPDAFDAWQRRGRATGWCRSPIRLVGATQRVDATTGQVLGCFASHQLPDRVLLKACGHRRATRCPTCSATYQADAYQLVAAGIRGGKGTPPTVADHPMIFVTLTAPSFGTVHTCRHNDVNLTSPCHSGTGACGHRQPRGCAESHPPDDPLLGQPLCPDCFDYQTAVLWNAHVGDLWRRTTIAARRAVASLAGIPAARLPSTVRLSFSKVVEYQRRGSVHVHAVIRLDANENAAEHPPTPLYADLLSKALMKAARAVTVPNPLLGATAPLRWGVQLDIRPIGSGGAAPNAVAGYLAKYATKSTDPAGVLDRRLRPGDIDHIDRLLTPHHAKMVRTAWDLGARPELQHLRLRAWAHTLGFRGHWLTKSRSYSTTFAALRSARQDWNLARSGQPQDDDQVTIGRWSYLGHGWTNEGDAWLAETAARRTADDRRTARLEHRGTTTKGDRDAHV